MMWDQSPSTIRAALPYLRRIADSAGEPPGRIVLARALGTVDAAEAEKLLRDGLTQAVGMRNSPLAAEPTQE
jgi:hypothetical protein